MSIATITMQECGKMIRAALKQGFPSTTFSVRNKVYSGGHSYTVSWTDGPTGKQVAPILDRYESKSFDGMIDMESWCGGRILAGRRVEVNGGYVHGSRTISRRLRQLVADSLARQCGLAVPVPLDQWGNVSHSLTVPYIWHPHWHRDARHNEIPLTLDDLEGPVLAHDSHEQHYFSQLVGTVEMATSLEAQRPIAAELLPEYMPEPKEKADD